MKRIVLLSIVAIFAVLGSACERHPATKLPLHYQHKLHGDHHDHSKDAHPAPAAKK